MGALPKHPINRASPSHSNSQSEGEFDVALYNKFMEFLSKQKMGEFKRRLYEFYGKNFTVAYNPQYEFD